MNSSYLDTGIYRNVDDPNFLRTVIVVLFGLAEEIDRQTDGLAELPDVDLQRLAMARAIRSMIMQRLRWAKTRLAELDVAPAMRQPVPDDLSGFSEPLAPMAVPVPGMPVDGLSSAEVWLYPGGTTIPRTNGNDLLVLILKGQVTLLWWDEYQQQHQSTHGAGQQLFVPAGVPYAAVNSGDRPVVAASFYGGRPLDVSQQAICLQPSIAHPRPAGDNQTSFRG